MQRLNTFDFLILVYYSQEGIVAHEAQKQPPKVSFKNKCSENLRKILQKASMLESLFNKVEHLQTTAS